MPSRPADRDTTAAQVDILPELLDRIEIRHAVKNAQHFRSPALRTFRRLSPPLVFRFAHLGSLPLVQRPAISPTPRQSQPLALLHKINQTLTINSVSIIKNTVRRITAHKTKKRSVDSDTQERIRKCLRLHSRRLLRAAYPTLFSQGVPATFFFAPLRICQQVCLKAQIHVNRILIAASTAT